MSDSRAHADAERRGRDRSSLRAALAITASFLAIEIAGGLWTGSLALLADAGHLATDVAGLALALFALRLAERAPTPDKTFGWLRTEILAALANGIALTLTALLIAFEAMQRIAMPPDVAARPMFWIAVAGLVANLVSAVLLHRGSRESLNVHAAFLHVVADALGSVGAILAALAIEAFGWRLADPIVAFAIAALVLGSAVRLVRSSVDVLMESAPRHIDVSRLANEMRALPGAVGVHDLHVWTLTSGYHAVSAHVDVAPGIDPAPMLARLVSLARERFAIDHTTFQIEVQDGENAPSCVEATGHCASGSTRIRDRDDSSPAGGGSRGFVTPEFHGS